MLSRICKLFNTSNYDQSIILRGNGISILDATSIANVLSNWNYAVKQQLVCLLKGCLNSLEIVGVYLFWAYLNKNVYFLKTIYILEDRWERQYLVLSLVGNKREREKNPEALNSLNNSLIVFIAGYSWNRKDTHKTDEWIPSRYGTRSKSAFYGVYWK